MPRPFTLQKTSLLHVMHRRAHVFNTQRMSLKRALMCRILHLYLQPLWAADRMVKMSAALYRMWSEPVITRTPRGAL